MTPFHATARRAAARALATAAVGLLAAAPAALADAPPANLLQNGGFERGRLVADNPYGHAATMSLPAGSAAIPGWRVVGAGAGWLGNANPFRLSAAEGERFLDLTDYEAGGRGGVETSFATAPGATYTVKFSLGSDSGFNPKAPAAVAVRVTGRAAAETFVHAGMGWDDWRTFAFDFTATSARTTLTFVAAGGGNYVGLDAVSVTAR